MGDPASAIIASSLLSTAGGAATAARQQSAQKRIHAQQISNQNELTRQKRVAEVAALTAKRQEGTTRNRLVEAKGTQLSNQALAGRGIKARPTGSFSGISTNVLDEGANV